MIADAVLDYLRTRDESANPGSVSKSPMATPVPGDDTVVLVVDDEAGIRQGVARMLKTQHCRTITTSDGQAAVDLCERERPDVVLLDISMPNVNGPQVLRSLRDRMGSEAPAVVWITGTVSPDSLTGAPGAVALLQKPFDDDDLQEVIDVFGHKKAA